MIKKNKKVKRHRNVLVVSGNPLRLSQGLLMYDNLMYGHVKM